MLLCPKACRFKGLIDSWMMCEAWMTWDDSWWGERRGFTLMEVLYARKRPVYCDCWHTDMYKPCAARHSSWNSNWPGILQTVHQTPLFQVCNLQGPWEASTSKPRREAHHLAICCGELECDAHGRLRILGPLGSQESQSFGQRQEFLAIPDRSFWSL